MRNDNIEELREKYKYAKCKDCLFLIFKDVEGNDMCFSCVDRPKYYSDKVRYEQGEVITDMDYYKSDKKEQPTKRQMPRNY